MKKLTEADAMGFLQVTPFGSKTISQYKNDSVIKIIKNIPLYTLDQITETTCLTQSEYDELKMIKNANNDLITDIRNLRNYPKLFKRFGDDIFGFLELLNPKNSEANIVIVKERWFVKRKLPNTGGNMLYCTEDGVLTYNNNKEHATQFDTKKEAEKWTNPLTEAVLLEVD